ncbi:hypothetical protein MKX03_011549 [Papaver bracteatum]|nr:hypothetical protein MKX03_011549 [Papaver bracteatum]
MATSTRINHLSAILICISIFTGNIGFPISVLPVKHIERNYNPVPADKCTSCTDWCKLNECRQVGDWQDCQCCCSTRPPTVPPAPPSRPPFAAYTSGLKRFAPNAPSNPLCETKCKEINLFAVRSECLGASRDGKEAAYNWYEQCCCGRQRPPCASTSLPPPCCGCCPVDVNIQISVKSGCNGDSCNSL